jgi:hypothetical protein
MQEETWQLQGNKHNKGLWLITIYPYETKPPSDSGCSIISPLCGTRSLHFHHSGVSGGSTLTRLSMQTCAEACTDLSGDLETPEDLPLYRPPTGQEENSPYIAQHWLDL